MTSPGPVEASAGGTKRLEDDALVARIAGGDRDSFGGFYDRFAGLIHGLCLRIVRDEAIAQEVTQEVFVELWRMAPRFDPAVGSARAWVATVTRRRAIDRVRSEQARRDRELADAGRVSVDFDDVSETVGDRLDRREVVARIAALSDPQREALTLAYYHGFTYRDVARRLDIPEGTAKTRIRDALNALRRELGARR